MTGRSLKDNNICGGTAGKLIIMYVPANHVLYPLLILALKKTHFPDKLVFILQFVKQVQ